MKRITKALLPVLLGIAIGATATSLSGQADAAGEVQRVIWAKEMAIYEGRSKGMVDFYIANASPHFLAWTAGTPKPFRLDTLRAGKQTMKGRDKELIETTFKDFSLSGDTAIIYYQNHRTRMPDGTAVDQTYDNIHVWQKTDGDWKVLASMSRPLHAGPAK